MKKYLLLLLFCLHTAIALHAQTGIAGPLVWEIYDDVLTIRGEGDMPDYDLVDNPVPWYEYKDLFSMVRICEDVTSIGNYAFYDCQNISFISIPASVSLIGIEVFSYCVNLAEIVNNSLIPQFLYPGTFYSSYLSSCVLRIPSASMDRYMASGWNDFTIDFIANSGISGSIEWVLSDDVLVIGGTGEIPIYLLDNIITDKNTKDKIRRIVINEGITDIVGIPFTSEYITSISIPGTVVRIDQTSLWSCEGLTSISVNEANQDYYSEDGVLINKNDKTLIAVPVGKSGSFTIPGTVEVIGGFAFNNCQQLTSLTISSSVKTMEDYAFYASGFASVSIPESVTKIAPNAFTLCKNLTAITIPSSVTEIGLNAFHHCDNLTAITVDANNPTYTSEDGVLFNKDMQLLVAFPFGKSGSYVIPESVSGIETYAFYDRTGLTAVTIPASVTTIGDLAFSGCINLSKVVSFIKEPFVINNNTFLGIDADCILHVPAASVDAYNTTDGWKQLKNIVAFETDIIITLDKKEIYLLTGATATLAVTVTGDIVDSDFVLWDNSVSEAAMVNYFCVTGYTDTGNGSKMLHACSATVTGISPGLTVITISAFGNEATCAVTVIEPGKSTIKGTINNAGTENIRVNLYIKAEETGQTKRGIVGGYVLLATTVPNDNGEYSFENLPEGSYQIQVDIEDYEPEVTDEIPLSENKNLTDVNFTVEEGKILVDADISTGAEELFASELKAYPNPFTDVLHLAGIVVETWHAASLRVINTAGTVVHTQTITYPDETIRLGHLPAGMYIIRLENGKRATIIKAVKR